MYAFGLEESNMYAKAEKTAKQVIYHKLFCYTSFKFDSILIVLTILSSFVYLTTLSKPTYEDDFLTAQLLFENHLGGNSGIQWGTATSVHLNKSYCKDLF
jgi:hypothetical protein